jgi:hypothetical protein
MALGRSGDNADNAAPIQLAPPVATVHNHIRAIYDILHAHSRAELLALFIENTAQLQG